MDFTVTYWPPDQDRLAGYKQRQQLFESEHFLALEKLSAKIPAHLRDRAYLVQDYPKLITTTYADLLFGQPPVLSLPGQQDLVDRLVEENGLFTTLYEGELSASFRGDVVYKLSVRPDPDRENNLRVWIEEVPAYCYFVESEQCHVRRLRSECLAWVECLYQEGRECRFLRVERHAPWEIKNELYLLGAGDSTKVIRRVPLSTLPWLSDLADVEPTRVPFTLLIHGPNLRHGSRFWGMPDYTNGLITLFDEANCRLTAIAHILDKHSDPTLSFPAGSIPNSKKHVRPEEVKVFQLEPGQMPPAYTTWDGQLGPAFNQLETVDAKIFDFSDVSPAMFGRDKAGNIESGRAMYMRFVRMLSRVSRKATYRGPLVKTLVWRGMQLAAAWSIPGWKKPVGQVEVVWRNGLPRDDKEATDVAVQRVINRLWSRETAIRYIDQTGSPEAQAELARLREEEAEDRALAGQESSGGSRHRV